MDTTKESELKLSTKYPTVIVLLAAVITLLAISGCGRISPFARIGELQTRTESVELDGANAERVEIQMGAGELDVSGGASELLQAKFTYNVASLEPQVKHSGGMLSVRTPHASNGLPPLRNLDEYRYKWDLHFNDHVPMDLSVDMRTGGAQLNLGSLSLTRLDLKTGLGPATVDLTGDWQNDLNATISGGLGDLTLRLPRSACVRVGIEHGVSSVDTQGLVKDGDRYINDACGEAQATLNIDVEGVVGFISLVEVA